MAKYWREGSKGLEVQRIQTALVDRGFATDIDGWFGDSTEQCVKAYQRSVGVIPDGVVGPTTYTCLVDGILPKWAVSLEAVEEAAEILGVDAASIMAVNQVESRGRGFLSNGKPKILFERHWMRRRLKSHGIQEAVINEYANERPNIVHSKPGGYVGGLDEHYRLNQAKKIHSEAAIESASWGRFQIMGFHWKTLGYESALDFEKKVSESGNENLKAFVRFIQADKKLHQALKRRQWRNFAKIYNGPAYEKNSYDVKLKTAYDSFVG